MGCTVSTEASKAYGVVEPEAAARVDLQGGRSLEELTRIAHAEDLAPRSPGTSAGGSPDNQFQRAKPTTQWDQLSPLLPLRSLRQLSAAQVLGRQPWAETVPGAVLVARLRGFDALCTDALVPQDSGAARAQGLSQLLDDLFHRLVQTVRALEGNVVHFTGDTLICAFSADAVSRRRGGGGGGGKEDELRGEADSQCVAACKCSLQLRQQVASWGERMSLSLSLSCGIGVGETAWVHLNAPPSRTNRDHFRSVILRGSAMDDANRSMAVALSLLAPPLHGRGCNDGVSVVSAEVWEIACDTFATETLEPAAAAAPDPHPWAASHRLLLRELPSGVATPGAEHAESSGLKPPSAVEAGLATDASAAAAPGGGGGGADDSHKGLLPYLTIARQRSGSPSELRPLVVMGFRIEMHSCSSSGIASQPGLSGSSSSSSSSSATTRVAMSDAQLNKVYGLVAEYVNSANGVLQHSVMGHLPLPDGDVGAASSAGILEAVAAAAAADATGGTAAAAAAPTHWCGLAVFGLTAVELDLHR